MRRSGRTQRCLTLVRMSQVNRLFIPHSLCISVLSPPCVLSFLCLSLSLLCLHRSLPERGGDRSVHPLAQLLAVWGRGESVSGRGAG